MNSTELILASLSPRRKQILNMLGYQFRQLTPFFEENHPNGLPAFELALYLARGKAESVPVEKCGDALVLASDTTVLLENQVLGKPENKNHAQQMLNQLSGRTHRVVTAVAVSRNGKVLEAGKEITAVTFTCLTPQEIEDYSASTEPGDKAGAYAVQGFGARWIRRIEGCYYNVMGLPVQLTRRLIDNHMKQYVEEKR